MKIKIIKIIGENLTNNKVSLGYLRIQIGCIFAEYDLLKPTFFIYIYIYEFSYKFDKVLYQFLETETSCITFMYNFQGLK